MRSPRSLLPPLLSLAAALALGAAASAQEPAGEPLRLTALTPAGARTSLTDGWGTLALNLANPAPDGRTARVLVSYADRPDVQYGRDLYLPGRSTIASWLAVGPPPGPAGARSARDVQVQLYDRTGGQERLVPPPGEERVRSFTLPYHRRELTASLLLDPAGEPDPALDLVRAARTAAGLTPDVQVAALGRLPPFAEALDGIDLFVVAGRRLADDPPGLRALRHWLHGGGRLWLLLDRTDPDAAARLLGDGPGLAVVGRTSLTSVAIRGRSGGAVVASQELEEPAELVRVLAAPEDEILYTVDGWPAALVRTVGRGRVLVTTLGARAWTRPRTAADGPSPDERFRDLPVPLPPVAELASALAPETSPFRMAAFEPLLGDEIGYEVVGPGPAALVFGAFLLTALGLGIGLRRSRRPELAGWVGPVAALPAAAVFFALGEASRRAVPPTVAVTQLVDVVPGSTEQPVRGLLALYRPDAGPAPISSDRGGRLELDQAGLSGQNRRLVMTDLGAWHWENLALPAGVRTGTFEFTARTDPPPSAVGRFGPDGLEGRLAPGPFRGLADALLSTPTRRPVAVSLRTDGTFTAGDGDQLAPGQYLSGAILSDRQQRRQAVYRHLLAESEPRYLEGRTTLLAWADPLETPFTLEPGAKAVGSALVAVPIAFERPPPGARLTVPRAFVPFVRLHDGRTDRPTLASEAGIDMHLRFQVPPSVLPLAVERARLTARVTAPGRRVSVAGRAGEEQVELFAADGPDQAVRIDITEGRLLRLDDQGGLHLELHVGELSPELGRGGQRVAWTVEGLGLEVTGRAEAGGPGGGT